jgi:hypothetical protein
MNKPSAGISVLLIAAVAGVVLWLLLRPGSPEETGVRRKVPAVREEATNSASAGTKPPVPEFGTEEFNKYALQRIQKWLASRNRDAASLVAAWDITGDEHLLDEAAERFPNDPRVCVAMINRPGAKAEALAWVERLIAAEPGNPSGLYWKAQILAESKKPEEALEALRGATATRGKPDNHLRDRMITVREAALASGATVKEAATVALTGPITRNGMPEVAGSTMRLLREQIAAAKAGGDAERVADVAALGVASAEHLGLSDAPSLMSVLVRQSMLTAMLKELDSQTEFGTTGKTAAERLSEVEAERAELKEYFKPADDSDKWPDNFYRMTEAQAAEYTDRFILRGEWDALKWSRTLPREGTGEK